MNQLKKWTVRVTAAFFSASVLLTTAFADGNFGSSKIATGTKALVNDLSTWATALCPTVGGLCAVFFIIRMSMSDEQDKKMWKHRATTAVICGVAGMLVSGIIALLSSYYK